MNAQQIVQFRMYKRLETILEQNAPTLSDYTIFNEVYLRFKTELARVETLAPQQENTTVGITQEKNSLKTQLQQELYRLGLSLTAYADYKNDKVLYHQVYYRKTDFHKPSEVELCQIGQFLVDKATEHQEHLTPFLVTPEGLQALKDRLTTFKNLINSPQLQLNEQSSITDALKKSFALVKDAVLDLDRWMKLLAQNHPELAKSYLEARQL